MGYAERAARAEGVAERAERAERAAAWAESAARAQEAIEREERPVAQAESARPEGVARAAVERSERTAARAEETAGRSARVKGAANRLERLERGRAAHPSHPSHPSNPLHPYRSVVCADPPHALVREAVEKYAVRSGGGAARPLPDDLDALEELGDEIAVLSAHIHAATHELLVLIRDFDRREGWTVGGHRSCANWLSVRTGIDLGAARQKVRVAKALEKLPETSAAMARGELSFSKVRALTRIATAENEEKLLEFARANTAAQLEKMVRQCRDLNRYDEAERERRRHASRSLAVFPDECGMYRVVGTLDPEVGVALMRAIEYASYALFREEGAHPLEPETTPAQRRADAIGLLAERVLEVGLGQAREEEDVEEQEVRDEREELAGAEDAGESEKGREAAEVEHGMGAAGDEKRAHRPSSSISGTRAGRVQVVLHVDPSTLARDGEPGRSHTEDGTRVSAETSRRLSCDCNLVLVRRGTDGSVLDVGRSTRTIPPAIRRALEIRDGGCRFPGCGLRFTDGHHIEHWIEGGETKLENLVLLCRFHHRAVHEDGFRVEMLPNQELRFYTPEGWPLGPGRPCVVVEHGDPVVALIQRNRRRGVRPARTTCSAQYEREVEIPDSLLFRAWEALDPS